MKKLILLITFFMAFSSANAQQSVSVKTKVDIKTQFEDSTPVRISIKISRGGQVMQAKVESLEDVSLYGQGLKQLIISAESRNNMSKDSIIFILANFLQFNTDILLDYKQLMDSIDPVIMTLENDPEYRKGILEYESIKAVNNVYLRLFKQDLRWVTEKLKEYNSGKL